MNLKWGPQLLFLCLTSLIYLGCSTSGGGSGSTAVPASPGVQVDSAKAMRLQQISDYTDKLQALVSQYETCNQKLPDEDSQCQEQMSLINALQLPALTPALTKTSSGSYQ